MSPIRVLMADDHAVLRAGLKALLAGEVDIEVVGEAGDGFECMEKVISLAPDVVLLDINMPRCSGLAALKEIQEKAPATRVLILTMHDEVGYLRQILASGGAGYVLKQAASDELLSAIRTVHDGGVFLHPHHARILANGGSDDLSGLSNAPNSEAEARYRSLSHREAEVLELVALGHRNSEIAEMLFLSVKTVETYKARLMKKLDLQSRAALVRFALELDILS